MWNTHLDAALETSYNRRTSLISGSSQTTQSSINRHNVMPLKFNPAALIPLWKHSKQSDCAFSRCTQHCASIWILFLNKSGGDKPVWNAKDVDQCRSKPLCARLLSHTHKLYANTSECWGICSCWSFPLFYLNRHIKTKLFVCLTTCVCPSHVL